MCIRDRFELSPAERRRAATQDEEPQKRSSVRFSGIPDKSTQSRHDEARRLSIMGARRVRLEAQLSLWPVMAWAEKLEEFPTFNRRGARLGACCEHVRPATAAALWEGVSPTARGDKSLNEEEEEKQRRLEVEEEIVRPHGNANARPVHAAAALAQDAHQ